MKRFAEVNVELLQGVPMLAMLIYVNNELVSTVARPFTSYSDIVDELVLYEVDNAETSTQALYAYIVQNQLGDIVYKRDLTSTERFIKRQESELMQIYGINLKPKPPRWMAFLYTQTKKITTKFEERYDYDN
ncbi:hypothetical protein [Rummeliibacillus sp. SL167]|uniref:hypothetical protein n=1 Tax=Rummeliibacillus sp. SL167 TaxID=2579792 RepID=UPI001C955240|nr:hypothetical protein [Rummeliibacillus sp. SL167]